MKVLITAKGNCKNCVKNNFGVTIDNQLGYNYPETDFASDLTRNMAYHPVGNKWRLIFQCSDPMARIRLQVWSCYFLIEITR